MAWTAPKTFVAGAVLTAAELNTHVRDNLLALKTTVSDHTSFGIQYAESTEVTVASGVIAPTQNFHRVDTQSDAATDDIDTITVGTDMDEGFVLLLVAENAARISTLKDATGNIDMNGADVALTAEEITILVLATSGNWILGSSPGLATPVAVTKGGTGLATVAQYDLLIASAADTIAALNIDTDGFVLTDLGSGPVWSRGLWEFVKAGTLSGGNLTAASLTTTNFRAILIVLMQITYSTDDVGCMLRLNADSGSNYVYHMQTSASSGTSGGGVASTGATRVDVFNAGSNGRNLGNAAGEVGQAWIVVHQGDDNNEFGMMGWQKWSDADGYQRGGVVVANYAGSVASVTEVKLEPNGGTIDGDSAMLVFGMR